VTPSSLAAANFDGDNNRDLVVGNSSNVVVLFGNGTGSFPSSTVPYTVGAGEGVVAVAAADFNGDGKADLAVLKVDAANLGSIGILLGDGQRGFSQPVWFPTYSGPSSLTVGDFDGDGRPDLATTSFIGCTPDGNGTISILMNRYTSVVSLRSPNNMAVDIQADSRGAGQLLQGSSNAFDGMGRLQVGNADYAPATQLANMSDGGQTVVTPTSSMSGLSVHREITVPNTDSQDFARTVDIFENPTGNPITASVHNPALADI
jgi:hypothetical protein